MKGLGDEICYTKCYNGDVVSIIHELFVLRTAFKVCRREREREREKALSVVIALRNTFIQQTNKYEDA